MKPLWCCYHDEHGRRQCTIQWWRCLAALFLLGSIPVALLVGYQAKIIYCPRCYAPGAVLRWKKETGGKTLDFTTSQGQQRAFLQGKLKSPRRLWLVCGGNGTLALEWSAWLREHAPAEDAWLLVDFPGYGDCQGSPNPARIRESLQQALPEACAALGWPRVPDPARVRFFGHSLGSAACLLAASEFGLQYGVLLAPFTSTMDMSRHLYRVPLGLLVTHRFDNGARLNELAARGHGKLIIFHGTADETIPVAMSRQLAALWPAGVSLREIPNGSHSTLTDQAGADLASALAEVGA